MKFPCVESTLDLIVGDFDLRLWINKTELPDDLTPEQELAQKLVKLTGYSLTGLIQKVISLVPNLNAIQVKFGAVGTVVYLVDFSSDVHG